MLVRIYWGLLLLLTDKNCRERIRPAASKQYKKQIESRTLNMAEEIVCVCCDRLHAWVTREQFTANSFRY